MPHPLHPSAAAPRSARQRILDGYVACIEDFPPDEVTITLIARRASVSTRTVYRHFPTRSELHAGLAEWSVEHFLPLVEFEHLDELAVAFRRVAQRLEERPRLARALASSELGRQVHGGLMHAVRDLIAEAVARDLPWLTPAQRHRLTAMISVLDDTPSWAHLHGHYGLDAEEMSGHFAWAVHALVAAAGEPQQAGVGASAPAKRSSVQPMSASVVAESRTRPM